MCPDKTAVESEHFPTMFLGGPFTSISTGHQSEDVTLTLLAVLPWLVDLHERCVYTIGSTQAVYL